MSADICNENHLHHQDQPHAYKDEPKSRTATGNGHYNGPTGGPLLVLVNPNSGRGKSMQIYKHKLLPLLQDKSIEHELFVTKANLRASDYLKQMEASELAKYETIVIVSGDGLLHEAVNAILSRSDWRDAINKPFGLVPSGSGNGLAYSLLRQAQAAGELSDEQGVEIFCDRVTSGQVCGSDLVKITYTPANGPKTVYSFLSIGWGLMADIDIDSEWLRCLGEVRFTIYGILRSVTAASQRVNLSYRPAKVQQSSLYDNVDLNQKHSNRQVSNKKSDDEYSVKHNDSSPPEVSKELVKKSQSEHADELELDSEGWCQLEGDFACIFAVSQSHIAKDTKIAPDSTPADRLIYLTYIRGKLSPLKKVEFLLAIHDGSHNKLPYVRVVPVTELQLQPLEPSRVVVDGEVLPWDVNDGPIKAQVEPDILKLRF